jgi:ferric-dicitrate binding protein FerR (iron transport regulator)
MKNPTHAPVPDLEREILELLDAFRDGPWDAPQQERLHTLLREIPEARRIFIQEQLLAADLHQLCQQSPLSGAETFPEAAAHAHKAERVPRAWSWQWGAAAALFLVGLLLGWAFRLPSAQALAEDTDNGVALLLQSVNASWVGPGAPHSGNILSCGSLKLTHGLAQIEFYSGARLLLHGPTELELRSANEAVCHSGRILVSVPPQARGFQLATPHGLIRDHGSEFGLETAPASASRLHVFSGALEVLPPESATPPPSPRRLNAGEGLVWNASGPLPQPPPAPESFSSFEEVRGQVEALNKKRYAEWLQWSQEISRDPRIVARYDFENQGPALRDSGPASAHGTIIGCEFSNGRWAQKGALEFKRPGDRVRVHIPGVYEALTLSAWIRVDTTPSRPLGLLLTDGYRPGYPHWQIAQGGQLRLGLSIKGPSGSPRPNGYGSPLLFTARQMGVWTFVATVYDNPMGVARHYFNAIEVASEKTAARQPVRIEGADIGNWTALPHVNEHPVRNFQGRIDELTIWSAALKAEEIRDIYEKTRP